MFTFVLLCFICCVYLFPRQKCHLQWLNLFCTRCVVFFSRKRSFFIFVSLFPPIWKKWTKTSVGVKVFPVMKKKKKGFEYFVWFLRVGGCKLATMMKFKSLFRRSQQGHQKQHRRLRHNNNNSAQPQASSTISLFKEQPHRCEGAALAAAPCWGSVTTLTSPSAKNHPAKNNQTLPKDFDRMQRLDPDVHANDKILVEKHKTELMWLKVSIFIYLFFLF